MAPSVVLGEDGVARCSWCVGNPDYVAYHDEEWGWPTSDDRRLFEKICLEGFQAGLSWLTILKKRARFREVFSHFDIDTLATYGEDDVDRLLGDAGIVRHRGKIHSAIQNSRRALAVRDEFGSLGAFVWGYEPIAQRSDPLSIPSHTPESLAMSRELKKRGWTFVGPTTMYAFMQSIGMVNDHMNGCAVRTEVEAARKQFTRPLPVVHRQGR